MSPHTKTEADVQALVKLLVEQAERELGYQPEGLLMTPIGWHWALLVWGYALAWLLANDRVKLLAHRLLDDGLPGWIRRAGPSRG